MQLSFYTFQMMKTSNEIKGHRTEWWNWRTFTIVYIENKIHNDAFAYHFPYHGPLMNKTRISNIVHQELEGRLTRIARTCAILSTQGLCPSEHPKLRLSIDGQLCINTFYILHLLFLPHECGQIHRKPPVLFMTQTRECTREQMYTVPRMGPEEL